MLLAGCLLWGCACRAQAWAGDQQIAVLYKNAGNADSALFFFEKALQQLPADSAFSNFRTSVLQEIGMIRYRVQSQYEKALPYFEQVAAILAKTKGSNSDDFAGNTFIIGQLYYKLKQNKASEKTYLAARDIYEKNHGKLSGGYAGMCNALGVLYNDWGKYEQALQTHEEARAVRLKLFTRQNASYAQSCNNLAAIYWNLGQPDKAEPLALEAKLLRETLPGVGRDLYAISCVNLANIYRDMGKFNAAIELYTQTKNIRDSIFGRHHEAYLESCDILASLYAYRKDYVAAEKLLTESKLLRDSMGANTGFAYAQNCSNLASAYMNLNQAAAAETLALEALAIFEKIGAAADADRAITQNLLGNIYYSEHKNKTALPCFLKARAYWRRALGPLHPFYNSGTLSLARLYSRQKKISKAAAYYRQAFNTDQYHLKNIFSFTAEKEKEQFVKNIQDNTDEYLSFYYEQLPKNNKGFPLYILTNSKSRILYATKKIREAVYNSHDSSLINQYNEWTGIKKQLATINPGVSPGYIAQLNTRADLLEKNISSSVNKNISARASIPVDYKTVLQPGEAAVEFFNFNYFDGYHYSGNQLYAALVMDGKSKEPQWVDLFNERVLDSLLHKSYSLAPAPDGGGKRGVIKLNKNGNPGHALYNMIWAPLDTRVKSCKKIYIAPSGQLNRISFASLPVDSVRLLSDAYQLQQISSTANIAGRQPFNWNSSAGIALYGAVDYNMDSGAANDGTVLFDYLPGTAREMDSIAALLPAGTSSRLYSGQAASEFNFKNNSSGQSPDIIHIATHGFYIPEKDSGYTASTALDSIFAAVSDPLLRSGLAMAGANGLMKNRPAASVQEDGILTAYEIANLNLSNTKLVVLSACETALGDINGSEGVYGLQRAFKMAGVQNIIMSLWAVPDGETVYFMKTFYKRLLEGSSIEDAFYNTQTIFKNMYKQQPEKWAAWVLYR